MKAKWFLIYGNLILILVIANTMIFQKERIIKKGDLVLLELAPVDPRSLIQGDYMRLDYAIHRDNFGKLPERGYIIAKRDVNYSVKSYRIAENTDSMSYDEIPIKYVGGRRLDFGGESYFFQEGHGDYYENAKYGGLRTNDKGNSVLVGLYDEDYELIVPPSKR